MAPGVARRNAVVLAASQAIVGSAPSICVSMGGLAGVYLLAADKSLATAPVTGFNIGVALGAVPAATLMRAVGRRNGFRSGVFLTGGGGALAALALFHSSFWLFCLGLLLVGGGNSFVQQYRFAAADNAPGGFKASAIAWVMTGGIFAGIIGPQTVIWTRQLFAPVMFAGCFAAIIALAAIGFGVLSFLRLPNDRPGAASTGGDARPLSTILSQPRFITGFLCGVGSYGLMSFVMTGAPLAMVGCGLSTDQAALGISWHVLAMYGPSFFTGRLISRFGNKRIIAAGLTLLVACALVSLSGLHLWQFWTALVLLGCGWNFSFIGATTMITETYHPSEKNKVQGVHDFMLFATVAFCSLMSGRVYDAYGWEVLNWIVFPAVLACFAALGALSFREAVSHSVS
jgi:MFS family permease